jgi:putative inorganic carbon (hco3(-)) transporter
MLSRKKNLLWAGLASAVFIGINAWFTANGSLVLNLLPLAALAILLAVVRLDSIYYLIVFFTPLSIQLSLLIPGIDADMSIPTEPMLFGVLLLLILREISGKKLNKRILLHPVSISIYISLAWMFITCITSSIPLVSYKYFLARIWFLGTFYFLAITVFQSNKKIVQFWWFYLIPFTVVVIYTLYRHIGLNLTQMTVHFMMKPFYNDHTSYGAMLAMYLPVLISIAVLYYKGGSLLKNTLTWLIIALFVFALIFSYTRAAWISVLGALVLFLILFFRIRFSILLTGFIAAIILFFTFQTTILLRLEKNKQDSSSNFAQHVESISNIATDASNLERINRWHSAIRMFKDRPFFGFGPGTYQFNYASYQLSSEKTIISTDFGNRGNSHSEYLGPLSESGLFGMVTMLGIITTVVVTGIRLYLKSKEKQVRILVMASLLGLVTYYFHGILNNFLDTDKASAPFWGFTAVIVALDLLQKSKDAEPDKNSLEE